MKILIDGTTEAELGADICQIEELVVPTLPVKAIDAARIWGAYPMSREDYDMWQEACDHSDNVSDVQRYAETEFGWKI